MPMPHRVVGYPLDKQLVMYILIYTRKHTLKTGENNQENRAWEKETKTNEWKPHFMIAQWTYTGGKATNQFKAKKMQPIISRYLIMNMIRASLIDKSNTQKSS